MLPPVVRERGSTAALQLKLDFVPGFDLLPGLGLCLSPRLHPGGIVTAGLPFGLLGHDTLRCVLARVDPRPWTDGA